ncbi:glycosyltransferase family 4 protein [Fervidobacterium pennivorans]|uniref:glycosyltransferase family 4 protein n=1 Tax=Fervidobacterium pennivorans TaxID=93466 RepID=UPI0014369D9B|nr:glycosyltransferase family 4 protein [Fervidobacterium pennivorans]QIV77634.1 glycosyltransferase family 4 protein [Fervidobacterium pennivorans subsp. keratinolyticus]
MKVLIISSIPWSESNRGIDIMTSFFIESGFNVTHIVFPNYMNSKQRWSRFLQHQETPENFSQIFSSRTLLAYSSKYMCWLPKSLKGFIFQSHIKTLTSVIDTSEFDIIVIESGKPVILSSILPRDRFVIYRQSDPIKLLNPNDKELIEEELKVMEKSNLVLTVRDVFKDWLPESIKKKAEVWVNGFDVPKGVDLSNPYQNSKKNAVYLGYSPLDVETLKIIADNHRDVDFHIIGRCLSKRKMQSLSQRYSNLIFYGNLSAKEYIPLIKFADFAIVPYANLEILKYVGLHSKFLLFMYFGLPIVSYKTHLLNERTVGGVFFAESAHEFSEKVFIAKKMGRVQYDIDFDFYSSKNRKRELKNILERYLGKIS